MVPLLEVEATGDNECENTRNGPSEQNVRLRGVLNPHD